MATFDYDFSGWATKNNYLCSDGRTIKPNAFKENHGQIVPLVWQHNHKEAYNVLGHALLENRADGVYAYCSFNDSEMADHARECVKHHDITALSIYAKVTEERNKNVMHGSIKEVSLCLSGANPGAVIDNIVMHSDEETNDGSYYMEYHVYDEEEAAWSDEAGTVDDTFAHADENKEEKPMPDNKETSGKTVQDVLEELTDEQSKVVEYVINEAVKSALDAAVKHSEMEETDMAHSVFENTTTQVAERPQIAPEDVSMVLSHAAQSNCGSLKLAVGDYLQAVNDAESDAIAHADTGVTVGDGTGVTYGIADIDWLFPNAKNLFDTPQFIKRRTEWVRKVFDGVRDVPFSRIKTMFVDITADAARAKGYVKGNRKVEEVVTLLKRETAPTTIYKKQKLDHDDIKDITDFDVVAFLKGEMRLMWEEEVARAILIGDGRDTLSTDKINEEKIRPIWTDDPLFTVPERVTIPADATDDQRTKLIIRKMIKAQDDYEGSGSPTLYTTQGFVSDCLLLEDADGRPRYDNLDKLTTALRVKEIVTVPVMKNLTRTVSGKTYNLVGLVVNLSDYARGADRGASAEFFEDFDLDFNQHKYLYEGRCSGALVTPYSALAIEYEVASSNTTTETTEEQPAG